MLDIDFFKCGFFLAGALRALTPAERTSAKSGSLTKGRIMAVRLEKPRAEHADELARIMYEAFAGISKRHGFPPDFPDVSVPRKMMEMVVNRPDVFGVVAIENDRVLGSNFAWMGDPVVGIGPITIDPNNQSKGVGRQLMRAVVEHAQSQGREMIRLVQDGFNMTSLSLYASLGFTVREPLAVMQAAPAREAPEGVRQAKPADIDAMDALAKRTAKVCRRNEIAGAFHSPFPPLVRERGGKVVAYLVPGFLGHGYAETDDDALALIGSTTQLPPPAQLFFAPLRQATLHRKASGGRLPRGQGDEPDDDRPVRRTHRDVDAVGDVLTQGCHPVYCTGLREGVAWALSVRRHDGRSACLRRCRCLRTGQRVLRHGSCRFPPPLSPGLRRAASTSAS